MVEAGWLGQFSLAREQLVRSRLPLENAQAGEEGREKRATIISLINGGNCWNARSCGVISMFCLLLEVYLGGGR
jgi:hypothetical protein